MNKEELINKIKYYYDNGFWTKERVKNMVTKKIITKKQCDEILQNNLRG